MLILPKSGRAIAQLDLRTKRRVCTAKGCGRSEEIVAQPQTNAIAGVRNAQQATQNAKAAEVELSADELQEIDAIGRTVTDHLDDNPVMWD